MGTIVCGYCGNESDLDNFCRTEIFGRLPKNVYQCPVCKTAFERKMGEARILENGFVIPGKITIQKVPSYL